MRVRTVSSPYRRGGNRTNFVTSLVLQSLGSTVFYLTSTAICGIIYCNQCLYTEDIYMFGSFDKTHYACICKKCGQLKIEDKSTAPEEYVCSMCFSRDLLVTSMTPSEARREKNERRWLSVLSRYFTQEEIEAMQRQTYGNTPDVTIPKKEGIRVKDSDCQSSCPTCHSQNVERISTLNRVTSIYLWGIFSSKINKQFVCKNCGYKW